MKADLKVYSDFIKKSVKEGKLIIVDNRNFIFDGVKHEIYKDENGWEVDGKEIYISKKSAIYFTCKYQ